MPAVDVTEPVVARAPEHRLFRLLGPAFVAAIAYVDPGNVAANLSAGAKYRYLLLWVLVAANLIAMVVQYLSAKFGVVTGRTSARPARRAAAAVGPARPTGCRPNSSPRRPTWRRSIGGALALHILFGIPAAAGWPDRRRGLDGDAAAAVPRGGNGRSSSWSSRCSR